MPFIQTPSPNYISLNHLGGVGKNVEGQIKNYTIVKSFREHISFFHIHCPPFLSRAAQLTKKYRDFTKYENGVTLSFDELRKRINGIRTAKTLQDGHIRR